MMTKQMCWILLAVLLWTVSVEAADGDFVWAKAIGGTGNDRGQAIAVDDVGNVYTTGSFKDTVDFDPGPGIFNLISVVMVVVH